MKNGKKKEKIDKKKDKKWANIFWECIKRVNQGGEYVGGRIRYRYEI